MWKHKKIYHLRHKIYINRLNLIGVLKTLFHNRVIDLISQSNVTDSLPTTNRFNINIGELRFVGKRQLHYQGDNPFLFWVPREGFSIPPGVSWEGEYSHFSFNHTCQPT